jgi:hypothetical protein
LHPIATGCDATETAAPHIAHDSVCTCRVIFDDGISSNGKRSTAAGALPSRARHRCFGNLPKAGSLGSEQNEFFPVCYRPNTSLATSLVTEGLALILAEESVPILGRRDPVGRLEISNEMAGIVVTDSHPDLLD